jgi:O-succinylhomoserine sulfhydrylase
LLEFVMASRSKRFRPATEAVHGGALRSQFGETSEAMFLTQGYVYPDAEAAEARFKGDDPGFVYSRYANPTVAMFEERMCLLEGRRRAAPRQAAWRRSPRR